MESPAVSSSLLWQYLLLLLVPVWIAAAFVDWWCHRRTGIEASSGLRECLLHWAMLLEIGIAVLVVAFCAVNALVLVLCAAVLAVHAATSWADLFYTDPRRRIAPVEQIAHGVLDSVPFAATSLLALLHWDQVLAIIGRGASAADWTLRWREPPWDYLVAFALLVGGFVLLPFAEELWRCWRVRDRNAAAAGVRSST